MLLVQAREKNKACASVCDCGWLSALLQAPPGRGVLTPGLGTQPHSSQTTTDLPALLALYTVALLHLQPQPSLPLYTQSPPYFPCAPAHWHTTTGAHHRRVVLPSVSAATAIATSTASSQAVQDVKTETAKNVKIAVDALCAGTQTPQVASEATANAVATVRLPSFVAHTEKCD